LPRKEIEAGWCESCGKKLPAYALGDRPETNPRQRDPQPSKGADSRSMLMRFIDALPVWLVLIFGLGGVGWEVEEYRVAHGTSADAVDVDLAALEKGGEPPQNHIRIGPHVRVYQALIYSSREEDKGLPDPPVDFVIYPVVSTGNPFMKKFREQIEADAELKLVEDMIIPPINDLRVLVLTKKYRKVSEIPRTDSPNDSITGLVVNPIRGLEKKELELLRQMHPEIDFSKTLILEEDRQPKSLLVALLISGAGWLLLLLAVVGLFRRVFVKTVAPS
jgi:hypothetical protein